jgi:hypothetical protein
MGIRALADIETMPQWVVGECADPKEEMERNRRVAKMYRTRAGYDKPPLPADLVLALSAKAAEHERTADALGARMLTRLRKAS